MPISLKSLLFKKPSMDSYYWMSPDGELYKVIAAHHLEKAMSLLATNYNKHFDRDHIKDENYSREIYNTMFGFGYVLIRITFHQSMGIMSIDRDASRMPSKSQKDVLIDLALENKIDRIYDIQSATYIPVD